MDKNSDHDLALRTAKKQRIDAEIDFNAKEAEVKRLQKEVDAAKKTAVEAQRILTERNPILASANRDLGELRKVLTKLDADVKSLERTKIYPAKLKCSDHALLRYLQRVKGVDLDAVREELLNSIPKIPKGTVTLGGVGFVILDNTVVTVTNSQQ